MSGVVRIGLSGWTYAGWRGVFYRKDLTQSRELSYAAERFPALEANGTFYGLQRPDAFARWREETPPDFVFAVKASRYITHRLRLKNVEIPLANFCASGLLRLGPKLGPILWQFPPQMQFDRERFAAFFDLLLRDTDEAARWRDVMTPVWIGATGLKATSRRCFVTRSKSGMRVSAIQHSSVCYGAIRLRSFAPTRSNGRC